MATKNQYVQIGSDGRAETYSDPFAAVTQEDVDLAIKVEDEIVAAKADVELGYQKIAYLLDQAEAQGLYKARGFAKFDDWVRSPEINISPRLAKDMVRIRREILPIAETITDNPISLLGEVGVSKARALLPLLKHENGDELVGKMLARSSDMTWPDVGSEVKRLMGKEKPIDQADPAMFKARITRGEENVRAEITGSDGLKSERLGVLLIPVEWWGRWEKRFGDLVTES